MPNPIVSVVVYISEPLSRSLSDSIASAAEQSFAAPEIIVVVKSELFEGAVKAEILRRGASIRYDVCDSRTTVGGMLRIGAEAARGRFITWLRADDVYDPRKIELQMDAVSSSAFGCATCGLRIFGQSFFTTTLDLRQDANSVISSLLSGTRDAATLLVSRECVAAAGGFSETFEHLPELDLATRLATRYPIRHVPAELLRRAPSRVSRAAWSAEFCQVASRIIEDDGPSGLVDRLEDLGRIASVLPKDAKTLIPSIQRRVAAIVGASNLCVGVLPPISGESANPKAIVEKLGVPKARALMLPREGDHLDAVAALAERNRSDWIMLIDTGAPLHSETFTRQMLQSAAEGLDACLPYPDPFIYRPTPVGSIIPGTLFRRSLLESLPIASMQSEEQFWAAFSRLGLIGALPPTAPVKRPDRSVVRERSDLPVQTIPPADLLIALIDREWYAAVNPDVAVQGVDPIDHFLNIGWRERRQPNPWFHTAWYLSKNPEVVERDMNPLEHFVLEGAAAGLRPSPSFDIVWYSKQYLDAARPCPEALLHFVTLGLSIGAVPYPQLRNSAAGRRIRNESRDESASSDKGWPLSQAEEKELVEALVDADWYRATYVRGGNSGFSAAAHYVEQGWRQGCDPNPWFDTRWYLSQNAHVQEEGVHPLNHFIRAGAKSGCKPHPFFDVHWYARHYLGDAEPSAEVLRHFLTIGLMTGAVPDSRIATPAVKRHLLGIPLVERSSVIKRLQNLLSQALGTGEVLKSVEADLWPLLFAEDFPADVAAVLVICESSEASRRLAAAAANILPLSERAIFGMIEDVHTLRITNKLHGDSISVKFQVHEQDSMLKDLLIQLNCQRASAVDERLLGTPVASMIRNTGVLLFTNGRRRPGSMPLYDLAGAAPCLDKMLDRGTSSVD